MGKNVDWSYFGVRAETQRRIIAHLVPLLDKGNGNLNIAVRRHKVAKVKQAEIKEQRAEGGERQICNWRKF